MKKRYKIMIVVIADLLLGAAVCGFGFTIGGKPQITFVIYAVFCSVILSYASAVFVKGRNCDKGSSFIQSLVILTVVSTVCMYLFYNSVNVLASDNIYQEYETTVEYYISSDRIIGSTVGFYNQDNELAEVSDYNFIWSDDDSAPVEGATLTIREYNGAFNYPIYEIEKVNGKEEK